MIDSPIIDVDPDEFDRILAVNLKGVLYGCQAAGKVMVAQRGGSIINMASAAVLAPAPGIGPYAICKAGVAQLTKSMAVEVGEHGVRVNSVAPGFVPTNMTARYYTNPDGTVNEAAKAAMLAPMARFAPLRRVGRRRTSRTACCISPRTPAASSRDSCSAPTAASPCTIDDRRRKPGPTRPRARPGPSAPRRPGAVPHHRRPSRLRPRAWLAEFPPDGRIRRAVVPGHRSAAVRGCHPAHPRAHLRRLRWPSPRTRPSCCVSTERPSGRRDCRSAKVDTLHAVAFGLRRWHPVRGRLRALPDDEVESRLTAIPGIGPWTVHGMLIIAFDRPDVVLPGDLACCARPSGRRTRWTTCRRHKRSSPSPRHGGPTAVWPRPCCFRPPSTLHRPGTVRTRRRWRRLGQAHEVELTRRGVGHDDGRAGADQVTADPTPTASAHGAVRIDAEDARGRRVGEADGQAALPPAGSSTSGPAAESTTLLVTEPL